MSDKFGRNFVLTVNPPEQVALPGGLTSTNQAILAQANTLPIVIQLPFSIEFDITHNIMSSANVAQIRIYNLNPNTRNQLRFNIMDGTSIYRSLILQAGYGQGPFPTIFKGNINQAWSVREGVDFVTTIECFDGGFALNNGLADSLPPFPANTPYSTAYKSMMAAFPQTTLGAIGNFPGNLPRGNSFSGPLVDSLNNEVDGGQGNKFFIYNEQAYLLNDFECVAGEMPLINSQSGLLNTPIRELNRLTFDMVFEPRIFLAQKIELQSDTDQNFNGFYKVNSIKHRGMISPAICGDLVSSVGLFYSPNGNALSVVPFLGGQQ